MTDTLTASLMKALATRSGPSGAMLPILSEAIRALIGP
jgi:hypothetical protein